MPGVITVSGRAVGRKKPLFADFSVPLPPGAGGGEGGFTLRDLIDRVVRCEVRAFREREEARRLDAVLTPAQIERGAERGKVAPEGRELQQDVDEEGAVGAALQAFEDGLYLVVIDGAEQRELDRQIYLRPDSRITFVRLVFLAGA